MGVRQRGFNLGEQGWAKEPLPSCKKHRGERSRAPLPFPPSMSRGGCCQRQFSRLKGK